MSKKVPSFSAIGQEAKEVLTGASKGVYQYNRKLVFTSKTSEGVEFVSTLVSTGAGGAAEPSVKAIYKQGKSSLSALFLPTGKITLTGSQSEVTPGLVLSLTGTYPETHSAKLAVDYTLPHVTIKSSAALTANNPVLDLAVTAGQPSLFAGADVSFDPSSQQLNKWTLGAGYTANEYQLGVLLLDKGETVRATYAHKVEAGKDFVVAGEVNYNINNNKNTTIIVGSQRRLDNGALVKARLDSESVLSLHYEALIHPSTIVGLSAQFNATKFDAAPKLGFAATAIA